MDGLNILPAPCTALPGQMDGPHVMTTTSAEPISQPSPFLAPAVRDQQPPIKNDEINAHLPPKVDVSSMRMLMDKLQLEVESSILRYKQEMNRMLDRNRVLEEDQWLRMVSQQSVVKVEGSRANQANDNDSPSSEERITEGLEDQQEQPKTTPLRDQEQTSHRSVFGRSVSPGSEMEPVIVDPDLSRAMVSWRGLANEGSNVDSMVRELAAKVQPHRNCLQRTAEFEVKAPQLVSKGSMLRTIATSKPYIWIRAFFFLLDTIVIIAELQHDSVTIAHDGRPAELPAFRWFSTIILVYMWLEMTFCFVLEFPKIDVLFGRTGYRFINEAAIIQHTVVVIAAHALPGERFTSNLRIFFAHFNFIRIFRTLVVVPSLGGTYLRQQLGELHIMIKALTGTVWPLFWCTVMYCIILVIFGVFFTEGAAASSLVSDANAADMVAHWIGVQNSVYTLSMAMLGGQDWGDLYNTLSPAGRVSKVGFLAFIGFTHIALLNTVIAVFIKCAFVQFDHDREFIVRQEQQEKRDYLLSVKQIFLELDTDVSGHLNLEELVQHLKNPEIAAYFTRLGVDTDEVQSVFFLMDEDHSNTISLEEFLWGCLRLRGSAKTLDLEILRQEFRFAVSMLLNIEASIKTRRTCWD